MSLFSCYSSVFCISQNGGSIGQTSVQDIVAMKDYQKTMPTPMQRKQDYDVIDVQWCACLTFELVKNMYQQFTLLV